MLSAAARFSVSSWAFFPAAARPSASLASYAMEKKRAKDPSRFGKGAIEGVAGPETANNAAATSSFIPLLTLGIPANATMAIIFGALLIQGVTPGPQLMSNDPELFWGVVNSMYIGNILLADHVHPAGWRLSSAFFGFAPPSLPRSPR